MCRKFEILARRLAALGHPLRLRILALLAEEGRSMYLSEIAARLRISRALAKVHLRKLERAGFVRSKVVLVEGEARALRYYELLDFEIRVTPETLKKLEGDPYEG
ncbi:MAG: ArsR family transcriptional regulator [Thermoprotei archaeon]|nr:MAG: ArsR family transcriptional regulator [Thermoprotei archaeon]